MTTPLTLLQHARLLITNPDNWTQGRLHDRDKTCFCAMGALAHARDRAFRLSDVQPSIKAFYEAEAILDSLTLERFGCSYVTYNDLESTTHADILHLFDAAIAEADAQAIRQAADSALPLATEPKPDNKPFDLEDYLVASRPLVEPTPTPAIEPLPVVEQLRSLDEALKELQAAQGALLNANSYLLDAEAEGFSVSVTTDPAQWQAAREAIKKRMDDLMPKFKAGDRVRLRESQHPGNIGALLTILGPVEGPVAGWYRAIADKPLLTVSCKVDKFGEMHDQEDPQETQEAQVFCTRIEKVARIEDLIGELVTDASDLLQICRGSRGWMVNLPTQDPYVEARGDDLLSALTNLRDKLKEPHK